MEKLKSSTSLNKNKDENNINDIYIDNNKDNEWEIHKFGGTSVATSECFIRCASILEDQVLGLKKHFSNVSLSKTSRTTEESMESKSSNNNKRVAIVVSAMGGKPKTTDLLLSLVKAASERKEETIEKTLNEVIEKHFKCIDELNLYTSKEEEDNLKNIITQNVADIRDILKTVSLLKWEAKRIAELVAGYGEIWSTQILCRLLNLRMEERRKMDSNHEEEEHVFVFVDARRFLTIDESAIPVPTICYKLSKEKLKQVYEEEVCYKQTKNVHLVITGYVASNTEGVCTTLGRDGSDYSASIIGNILSSTSVTIWTDVDGVMSADPRRVPEAYIIPHVSFNEAMELAYFGAKVIHPKTMVPALAAFPDPIPIFIRNTFEPSVEGTRIFTTSSTSQTGDRCVCGFTSIEDMALVNVEGSGLIGVHGIAKRLFGTLESIGVNVVLISQASSEHTITFATVAKQAPKAKIAIEEEFRNELRHAHMAAVEVISPCSVIAAVGDGMHATAGVAGRFFTALGDAKINILAISQGSSERNISAVVTMDESTKALRAVHAAFRLSHTVARVGIVGMNELGYSLLELLESRRDALRNVFEIDVQVRAVLPNNASSEQQIITLEDSGNNNHSITPLAYDMYTNKSQVEASLLNALQLTYKVEEDSDSETPAVTGIQGDISTFSKDVQSYDCAHNIIIDCTSDEEVAKYHPVWLNENVHVITANNTGLSGSNELRQEIYKMERATKSTVSSAKYLTELTVGGALPIIRTLRDLLKSGDKIRRVSGILSVSMSYIFHRIAPPPGFAQSFSYDKEVSHGAIEGSLYLTSKLPSALHNNSSSVACSFSTAVKEAIALGLMEEDPLKDLTNEYTARVLMVLAKELGLDSQYDIERIQLNSDMLIVDVEQEMGTGKVTRKPIQNVEKYEDIADQLDTFMHERVVNAAKKGCVPRHISTIDVSTGEIHVKIMDVPCNHLFAINPPSCECVRFYTKTHNRYPLVIQGPSAGTDSVVRGLLAELLNLMQAKVGVMTGTLSHTSSSAFLS